MGSKRTMIRLGLIGVGRWGRQYIRTIQGLDGVFLARVGSRNPTTRALVDDGCLIFDDWRQVINRKEVDGVVIATPPALHDPMIQEALCSRMPALVEKPLTTDLNVAVALRRLASTSNTLVMVDHTHLYHPAFQAIKELGDTFGKVMAMRSQAGNWGPYRDDVSVLWDWGPHDVAMCLDLIKATPREAKVERLEERKTEGGYGENLFIRLVFAEGITAEIRIGTLMPKTRRFAVHFDTGIMVYDDLAERKLTLHLPTQGFGDPKNPGKGIDILNELPLTRVVKTFVEAISAGVHDSASLDLGVDVVSVLAKCECTLKNPGVK